MTTCIHCNSTNVGSRGKTKQNVSRFKCNDCLKWFQTDYKKEDEIIHVKEIETLDGFIDKTKKVFVVTSAQSNTSINEQFFAALNHYVKFRDAQLIVIPVLYNNPNAFNQPEDEVFDKRLTNSLSSQNIRLSKKLKIVGSLRINACAESPLSGLDSITKGDSIIVGHNQLELKTLAVQQDDLPVIMTTTGTISEKNYSESKLGMKASHNHSFSACVVELDGDIFHLRHLNFDGKGFYDFEYYYDENGFTLYDGDVTLITGDEHVTFADPLVTAATYTSPKSIVNVLKPKTIVRHDIIDTFSVSSHHQKDVFTQYAKSISDANDLKAELDEVVNYICDTGKNSKNVIVSSNHHDHIVRWLNEADPKLDPKNALIYHQLMYKMLSNTTFKDMKVYYPNPLELYSKDSFKEMNIDIIFLSRTESFKIHGIELASHGDKGSNGSRGSRKQFSRLPSKTIIGHSHSAGILQGCYQVGTSSILKMNYNLGPSSWSQTHCLIYPNGKRQLISIIDGKFRLD